MAMSDKTKSVLEYLKGIGNENVTTADIAEALGLEKKSVEGVVTSGLQRKGLAERVPAQIEATDENGNKKYVDVKFVKLTAEGKAFRAWRSAVWAKGYEILAQVQAGQRGIPTEAELIAELPVLVIDYENASA